MSRQDPPRPKPHDLLFPIAVTSLNVTSTIPAGELPFVPARIPRFSETFPHGKRGVRESGYNRAFYGLRCNTGSTGSYEGADPPSPMTAPPTYETVCPDSNRFPSRSISTSEFGVTRKNRHVPCFDRSSIGYLEAFLIHTLQTAGSVSSYQFPGANRL